MQYENIQTQRRNHKMQNKIQNCMHDEKFLQQVHSFIYNWKEKVSKTTKAKQVEKLAKLIAANTTASREPDQDSLKEKWVYNLSSNPLTSVEKFLLQKCKKFAVTPSSRLIRGKQTFWKNRLYRILCQSKGCPYQVHKQTKTLSV